MLNNTEFLDPDKLRERDPWNGQTGVQTSFDGITFYGGTWESNVFSLKSKMSELMKNRSRIQKTAESLKKII